ncbi:MAG: GNAT family N-acetyltransferase [Oscillatoriales cyanobacterium RU_3_3]|nr:GNAT family N-acetyltransferase [Oscillatoriales cyanobacterium RU_3_3]
MNRRFSIINYSNQYRSAIRKILKPIGWAEQYISAAEQNADVFSQNIELYGVYIALHGDEAIAFIYVQFHVWNRLAQIQGLAVEPNYQRQGIASALVDRAEAFARDKKARGIYVDTPVSNVKGRSFYEAVGYNCAYIMPHYYEDNLDGVTYQKFFD